MAWRDNQLLRTAVNSSLDETPLTKNKNGPGFKTEKYLEFSSSKNPNGILEEIIFLGIDVILYASLLYTVEQGYISRLLSYKFHSSEKKKLAKGTTVVKDVSSKSKKDEKPVGMSKNGKKSKPKSQNKKQPDGKVKPKGQKKNVSASLTQVNVAILGSQHVEKSTIHTQDKNVKLKTQSESGSGNHTEDLDDQVESQYNTDDFGEEEKAESDSLKEDELVDDDVIDEDVQWECKKIAELTSNINANDSVNNVFLVHKLKKMFNGSLITVVNNVTFRDRKGQCFGLLGLNGAGKMSTFQMLIGDIMPTDGNSSLLNISLKKNKVKYLSECGYCAENNCILKNLTGREILTLVASLRGLRKSEREAEMGKWLSVLGLLSIANNRCSTYSGGEKRKICTVLSLIGDPKVVFLDGPTRGADPLSRHTLYDIMDHNKSFSGQIIVLSSHSVPECVAILCNGDMKYVNLSHNLRNKYARGYTITVKLRKLPSSDMIKMLPEFKKAVMSQFQSGTYELKDASQDRLRFLVKDETLLWSVIFTKMELLKANQKIMEDYIVSETTLEEVFVTLAKPL